MSGSTFTGKNLVEQWKSWMISRGMSETSIIYQGPIMQSYFDYVIQKNERSKKPRSIRKIEDITWLDFRDWRDHLLNEVKNSKNSVMTKMSTIYSLYRMLYEQNMNQKYLNLYQRMKAVPKPRNIKASVKSHKPVKLELIDKMLEISKNETFHPRSALVESYIFLMVLLYTSQRAAIYGLMIREIKWDLDEIHLERIKGMGGGKGLKIPLHPDLKIVLKNHLAERYYESDYVFKYASPNDTHQHRKNNSSNAYRIVSKIGKLAGHDDICPHRFRKTVGSYLNKKGVSLKIIQALMGHEDYKVTANLYSETDLEDVKIEFSKHSFLEMGVDEPKAELLAQFANLPDETLEKLLAVVS